VEGEAKGIKPGRACRESERKEKTRALLNAWMQQGEEKTGNQSVSLRGRRSRRGLYCSGEPQKKKGEGKVQKKGMTCPYRKREIHYSNFEQRKKEEG